MPPSTAVGARDLGDIALYWRAMQRPDLAEAFATDPRRGKRARDGLRFPNLDRDSSCNFRPVLLAGLGDWKGLADWCRSYFEFGWQLREWNSPTYTARVLAAIAVGAAQAPAHSAERTVLREALQRWVDLLALMAVLRPAAPLRGRYGTTEIEVNRLPHWERIAIAPAGMRANRWTALQHGANGVLNALLNPQVAAKFRARDKARPAMPVIPTVHERPIPGRSKAVVSALPRVLSRGRCAQLHDVIRGDRKAIAIVAKRLRNSKLKTWRHLRVRIQRRGIVVFVALSRTTSAQKGGVTAARISPRGLEMQAVSPLRSVSRQPSVKWNATGVTAVAHDGSARSTMEWLTDPWVDLTIDRHGVELSP